MKFSTSVLALFALSAAAVPHIKVKRAAVNQGALDLIAHLEGFRANFYTDSVGDTAIGYGHDCEANQDCSSIHAPITEAQGKELLAKDIKTFEDCVCEMDNAADLNANEYGALVSFAYNSGCGGVDTYWHTAMSEKNFEGICEALPHTNTLNGVLDSRRAQEGAFCSKPSNATSGC
ncbi:hypothetical protein N7474_004430 [Penicillium riverlandense]|uniref:uncharacterized protein n=1 Tax=Penicillium riverlandense TaxID=1903569 RepID=UPI002546CDA7|nr:uncharacterized protein N7474_004430 [Penicillium riverlandense]KAJ5818839.1 hypothetical protein N7474_004430 [Penicillium riverlandense]